MTLSLSILISFHTTCNFTYYIHLHWPFSTLIYEIQSCLGNFAHTFWSAWKNIPQALNAHSVSSLRRQIKCPVFGKTFPNHTICRGFLILNYLPSHQHIPISQSEIILFLFPCTFSIYCLSFTRL